MLATFAFKIAIFGVCGCGWGLYCLEKWFAFSLARGSIGATLTSNRHWNEVFLPFSLRVVLGSHPQ